MARGPVSSAYRPPAGRRDRAGRFLVTVTVVTEQVPGKALESAHLTEEHAARLPLTTPERRERSQAGG